jgi:polysaccharide export outer membrane protein
MQIHRRGDDGSQQVIEPKLEQALEPNDVIFVKESLF